MRKSETLLQNDSRMVRSSQSAVVVRSEPLRSGPVHG
jgi:hypothetical protein